MSGSIPSDAGGTHVLSSIDIEIQKQGEDSEDSLTGRVLDGRYRIGPKLGQGGVGVVYAGEHVDIKKKVALKVLHGALGWRDTFRQRFEREAQASSKLSHPGCVSVIDFGRIAKVDPPSPTEPGEPEPLLGTPYLVMELVRGEVLADRMNGRALPPDEAVRITRALLSALRHAHGLGIVHRDIKPANIMLSPASDPEPWVKILDFGLAKDLDGEDRGLQKPLTEVGMVFGTPGYLSPEQAAGQRADARSDLYSLGVALFEMVCGRQPFVHANRMQVVRDHLSTPPPRAKSLAPAISDPLDAAIAKALSKKPDDRYANADEFAAALAACPEAQGQVTTAAGSGPLPAAPSAAPVEPSTRTTAPTTPARPSTMPPGSPSTVTRIREMVSTHRLAALVSAALMVGLIGVAVFIARKPAAAPPAVAPPTVAVPSPSARRHLTMADDYQKKLWCSDALDELERAIRPAPDGLSVPPTSPDVARIAASCLRTKTHRRAAKFLTEVVGPPAVPTLMSVAESDPRPDVRTAAKALLEELSH